MTAAVVRARALPPESPLTMVHQPIGARAHGLRAGGTWRTAIATVSARLLLLTLTAAISAYGVREMHGVMAPNGVTALQWVFLVLFAVNFVWVAYAAAQAIIGFLRGLWVDLFRVRPKTGNRGTLTTALLIPAYNEDPRRIAALATGLACDLAIRAPDRFAVFILSDTTRPDAWIREEAVFAPLIARADPACPIHYRHRRDNAERKPGNIADWVRRWGGAYDAMLILDADSVMAPETVVEMADRMNADPGLGLLQTLPSIVWARSFYGRLQQFANRCYGPIFGEGLAAWHGRSGNFWGHNAIVRTRAFAQSAGLPRLRGRPPFGGLILSHDFIEAGLLRRAGWGVRMDTDLTASYEEAPPSLFDVTARDRRWAQGNLQHARFLFARGLAFPTRVHLATGIMAYGSAVLWFLLFVVGFVVAIQAGVTRPEYFSEPSLFPNWPVFDSERAIALFIVAMGVVLLPKALGFLAVLLRPRRLMGFGGPILLPLSVATEVLFSALYAPIMMIGQSQIVFDVLTGRGSDWKPQRRGDGRVRFSAALRAKRWQMLIGVALAGLAYWLNPDLFLWVLPVTAGLILAAPLAWISGSGLVGGALRRVGILRTPEEKAAHRPAVLEDLDRRLGEAAPVPDGSLSTLAAHPLLRDWHLAQLPVATGAPPPFDPHLVLGRAKADIATDLDALEIWLTREEAMALLHDRTFVEGLGVEGLGADA